MNLDSVVLEGRVCRPLDYVVKLFGYPLFPKYIVIHSVIILRV